MDAGADDYVAKAVPYGRSAGPAARTAAPLGGTCRQRHHLRADGPRYQGGAGHGPRPSDQAHLARIPRAALFDDAPRPRGVRTELVEHLYEQDFDRDSNTVEVFIGRLRKKLPADLIKTVRGLGYRLTENPDGA